MIPYTHKTRIPDGKVVYLDLRRKTVTVYGHDISYHFREKYDTRLERRNYKSDWEARNGYNEVCGIWMNKYDIAKAGGHRANPAYFNVTNGDVFRVQHMHIEDNTSDADGHIHTD